MREGKVIVNHKRFKEVVFNMGRAYAKEFYTDFKTIRNELNHEQSFLDAAHLTEDELTKMCERRKR